MTDDKITVLPTPGYNKQVVEQLEELLEDAKKGEIISLTTIVERKGGFFENIWTGTDDLFVLAGQAARLQHVLQCRIDDN